MHVREPQCGLALSIRQPFAELILRGIKTLEYRSRPTRRVGERFWIYASQKLAVVSCELLVKTWSNDLSAEQAPKWLAELAEQVGMISDAERLALPRGVVVGSAIISDVQVVGGGLLVGNADNQQPATHSLQPTIYSWHLTDVRRAKKLRKPSGHPQPVWFRPW